METCSGRLGQHRRDPAILPAPLFFEARTHRYLTVQQNEPSNSSADRGREWGMCLYPPVAQLRIRWARGLALLDNMQAL